MGADIPIGATAGSPTDDELLAARQGDAAALEALLVRGTGNRCRPAPCRSCAEPGTERHESGTGGPPDAIVLMVYLIFAMTLYRLRPVRQ